MDDVPFGLVRNSLGNLLRFVKVRAFPTPAAANAPLAGVGGSGSDNSSPVDERGVSVAFFVDEGRGRFWFWFMGSGDLNTWVCVSAGEARGLKAEAARVLILLLWAGAVSPSSSSLVVRVDGVALNFWGVWDLSGLWPTCDRPGDVAVRLVGRRCVSPL